VPFAESIASVSSAIVDETSPRFALEKERPAIEYELPATAIASRQVTYLSRREVRVARGSPIKSPLAIYLLVCQTYRSDLE
jgi:hypothetical protein